MVSMNLDDLSTGDFAFLLSEPTNDSRTSTLTFPEFDESTNALNTTTPMSLRFESSRWYSSLNLSCGN